MRVKMLHNEKFWCVQFKLLQLLLTTNRCTSDEHTNDLDSSGNNKTWIDDF